MYYRLSRKRIKTSEKIHFERIQSFHVSDRKKGREGRDNKGDLFLSPSRLLDNLPASMIRMFREVNGEVGQVHRAGFPLGELFESVLLLFSFFPPVFVFRGGASISRWFLRCLGLPAAPFSLLFQEGTLGGMILYNHLTFRILYNYDPHRPGSPPPVLLSSPLLLLNGCSISQKKFMLLGLKCNQ